MSDAKIPQEKINGLIALMNRGIYEGEKSAARRALMRLCTKYGVNFEDLVSTEEPKKRYSFVTNDISERKILRQTLARYAGVTEFFTLKHYRKNRVFFECTPTKYLEAMAAWSVLKIAYEDERGIFTSAFINKHHLFPQKDDQSEEEDEKPMTLEERQRIFRIAQAMQGMNNVDVLKQISPPHP